MLELNDRDIAEIIRVEREAATKDLRAENERLRVALKNVIESMQDNDEIAAIAYAKTALTPARG